MSIFEYDEEKHLRNEREEGIRLGIKQGIELKLFLLVCKKLAKGKTAVEIAEDLEEQEDVIQVMCEKAAVYAPEFDEKRIREDWHSRQLS
ncbi:MAG: hypothetical protein K2K20_07145 [Lachnospiraceae bacterium]|nr:hypothetical protein [Lachnospiraceae bacterium]